MLVATNIRSASNVLVRLDFAKSLANNRGGGWAKRKALCYEAQSHIVASGRVIRGVIAVDRGAARRQSHKPDLSGVRLSGECFVQTVDAHIENHLS